MKRTNVGRAIVDIVAKGDGMNKDIVDEVDKATDGVEKSGDEAGDRYGARFSDRFRDRMDDMREKVASRLNRDLGDAGEKTGDDMGRRMTDRIHLRAKNASRRIGVTLGNGIGGGMSDRIEDMVARMLDDIEDRITQKFNGGGGGGASSKRKYPSPNADDRTLAQAYRMNEEWHRARLRMLESAERLNIAAEKKRHVMIQQAYQMNETFDRKRTLMLVQAHRMNEKFNAGRLNGQGHVSGNSRSSGAAATGGLLGALLSGKAFGRGSRMDGLHYFGTLMGSVTKGAVGLLKIGGKAVKGFTDLFMEGFNGAADSAGILRKTMAGMGNVASGAGSSLMALAASGPALAAAAGVAVVAVGALGVAIAALVNIAGGLLGVLTMLVGVTAMGLTGGMYVLGGAMAGLLATAGLLTAAFMSMTDAQKGLLKDAFIPLREQMVGIGQMMLKDMIPAFQTWSANLQSAAQLAVPAASQMGGAFAAAGNIITAALSGPGFQKFADMMTVYMPRITLAMSNALGSFLNGLMATFAALTPSVARFADYLQRVTARFSEWANSAQGQNAIATFVDKAINSLASLWNVVVQFGGLMKDIFFSDAAQAEGIKMFDGMADGLRRMRDAVMKAVEDGSLQKWFEDARVFGANLWSVIEALWGTLKALYDSGVINGVGEAFATMASFIQWLNGLISPLVETFGSVLPGAMNIVLGPIQNVISALRSLGDEAKWAIDMLRHVPGVDRIFKGVQGMSSGPQSNPQVELTSGAPRLNNGGYTPPAYPAPSAYPSLSGLRRSGAAALGQTDLPKPEDVKIPDYVNPYKKWAESLMNSGPTFAQELRRALKKVNTDVRKAVREATDAANAAEVRSLLKGQVDAIRANAKSQVEAARSALNSAASSLASASSPEEAAKALAQVRKAQKDLDKALAAQKKSNKAAQILNNQKVLKGGNVEKLLKGWKVQNATLADYARARQVVSQRLEKANQKLAEAIALRDDYRTAISDSIKSFGNLLTAQAEVINGVEQKLTATDITKNLWDRLGQIKKFQSDLNILLARGLSNDAYKQILDGGVEQGGEYAAALVAGGIGSVNQVNMLTDQINKTADAMGLAASSRMYQAGVDAAKGLVEGLTSLSKELDSAAARLGEAIARAVKKALGIKSPSRVMMEAMGYVGDGMVTGLNAQHQKVGTAAASLSSMIAFTPQQAAAYAAPAPGPAPSVSGNDDSGRLFRDLVVQTPTTDPEAVAIETVNELTGRL